MKSKKLNTKRSSRSLKRLAELLSTAHEVNVTARVLKVDTDVVSEERITELVAR